MESLVLAIARHGRRIFSLGAPMHDLAMFIGYVELQHAMRIGPKPLGDGPLDRYFSVRFIGCVSVVRG